MKYLLMLHAAGKAPYAFAAWSGRDWDQHVAFLTQLNRELRASGELVEVLVLESPDHAVRVRADKNGLPITDGVFAESKEFLAGFWMLDVPSAERAVEIAARASLAPGPGGVPLNMAIEVREVLPPPR